ncbi:MAG: hypothetical protein RJB66_1202 [Pseudomonadota bacterium]|jgi:hypothetical protein
MKKKGANYFYLFVFLLVIGVYYFDYYRGEESKSSEEQAAILLPVPKNEIQKIELKNTSGDLQLSREKGDWELKQPVVDLAAEDEINGWLQALTTEKSLEKIGAGEEIDWATYGLDSPRSSIKIFLTSGREITIEVSARKNFEGNTFIRKSNDKVVYVGAPVWSSLTERNMKDLRDKRILRQPLTALKGFSLKKGDDEVRLVLNEGRWISVLKPKWSLDQNKVRELVNSVQNMKATDFVIETEPIGSQVSEFGFGSTRLKIAFEVENSKDHSFEFGMGKDRQWYVWPKDLKKVFKVDSANVEKLTKANLDGLRDRELPFTFNKQDVKGLKISGDAQLVISRENERWKSSNQPAPESVSVDQLIESLRQVRVAEFLEGRLTAPGLDSPKKRYALLNGEGKSLLELTIGDSLKKKDEDVVKTFFYAKSSLLPDVILISEDDVKMLALDKLFKSDQKEEEIKTEAQDKSSGFKQ